MKVKIEKNIFIMIITLILGIIIGIGISELYLKKESVDKTTDSKENDYIQTIKNDENKNESTEKIITKLEELESELKDIDSQKIEIQSQIVLLQNELNLVTNFEYEEDIYPDIEYNEENVENDSVE